MRENINSKGRCKEIYSKTVNDIGFTVDRCQALTLAKDLLDAVLRAWPVIYITAIRRKDAEGNKWLTVYGHDTLRNPRTARLPKAAAAARSRSG